jgi:hypothetical protein
MPGDGAVVLSDLRSPALSIVCEPCGRRGTLQTGAPHGTARRRQADRSASTLVDCPKAGSASVHDRCKAVFGQPLL